MVLQGFAITYSEYRSLKLLVFFSVNRTFSVIGQGVEKRWVDVTLPPHAIIQMSSIHSKEYKLVCLAGEGAKEATLPYSV